MSVVERSGAREKSEWCGASERVSGVSGRASGPVTYVLIQGCVLHDGAMGFLLAFSSEMVEKTLIKFCFLCNF